MPLFMPKVVIILFQVQVHQFMLAIQVPMGLLCFPLPSQPGLKPEIMDFLLAGLGSEPLFLSSQEQSWWFLQKLG